MYRTVRTYIVQGGKWYCIAEEKETENDKKCRIKTGNKMINRTDNCRGKEDG